MSQKKPPKVVPLFEGLPTNDEETTPVDRLLQGLLGAPYVGVIVLGLTAEGAIEPSYQMPDDMPDPYVMGQLHLCLTQAHAAMLRGEWWGDGED